MIVSLGYLFEFHSEEGVGQKVRRLDGQEVRPRGNEVAVLTFASQVLR